MRKNKLIQRILVAYRFIRYGNGKCRIMTCGKCGSILISPISVHPTESKCYDETRQIDLIWSDFNQCMKCGAVCQEIQLWNYEGDPTKIDKRVTARKSTTHD